MLIPSSDSVVLRYTDLESRESRVIVPLVLVVVTARA
jgi:hypothetical protein